MAGYAALISFKAGLTGLSMNSRPWNLRPDEPKWPDTYPRPRGCPASRVIPTTATGQMLVES